MKSRQGGGILKIESPVKVEVSIGVKVKVLVNESINSTP